MSEFFPKTLEFIFSLYPHDRPVPLHAPRFFGREKEYLAACIDSTFVSYSGVDVEKFESAIREYTGAGNAVAAVNGTAALFVSLLAVGVKPGDEVITQALTFVATANAIRHCGADPVFLDVDRPSLGLSAGRLADFLENRTTSSGGSLTDKDTGKRIAAVVPVHTFGHPADIDDIIAVCDRYGLAVVEDAAEGLGSLYRGRHVGTAGRIGVLSFNGNKTVTTGGGGMILTNDADLARRIRHVTTTAKVPHPYEFFHDEVGYNFRMPSLNAAIGLAQMEHIDFIVDNKRSTAALYRDFFTQTDIGFFSERNNCRANYWLNIVFLKDRKTRDEFLQYMNGNGVQTRPVWTLLNTLPMYRDCPADSLEISRAVADTLVNLPSSVRL